MTIQTLLEPFAHFGVRLGLETSHILLRHLGDPQEQVPVIHVAGSNGKGSVCAYLSTILVEAGYQVGRYTSPHLMDWNERICLNNKPIPTLRLIQLLEKVIAAARMQDPLPTQFEMMTAAAWLYFAQNNVDIAVMEVGLGGRLDATNVCDRPLVSVITSISREHWQVLGSTLAEIASEKAGILKADCPAVIGQLPPEANVVIYRRAAELGCETTYPQPARDLGDGWVEYRGIEEYELASEPLLEDAIEEPYEVEELYEEPYEEEYGELEEEEADEIAIVHMMTTIRYRLPLHGVIQRHNSALAIAAIQILREQGWEVLDDAIIDGIAKTQWAGRLQWLNWGDRQILIDGAHNPASAQVLREFIDSLKAENEASFVTRHGSLENKGHPTPNPQPPTPSGSTHWVMGMLATKDHADIFKALLREGDRLSLVPVPDHKTADPETLAALAREICPGLLQSAPYPDALTALDRATQDSDRLVVLCGSLYLVGQVLKTLRAL
ncbi:MAG: folylpolyglutamate synthase/dihydrofolate synthase family protein [Leptolyngbyaceae cyanobacterium bins.302]|nr:folylpolyglutamate synthase/dihydrofolate synthase family protein [Leptolyngbyaceae cyanobacterium bins.302]